MARRGSITEEQVFSAADALVAQGREVTPTALLNSLGSGSFTTIYKHMEAWEASRASAVTDKAAAIPDAVFSAFGAAWRAAAAEAGKEVVIVREQAAQEVKTVKGQLQEALDTIERLESEADSDAENIERLTSAVAELEKSFQVVNSEKAVLSSTVEQLQRVIDSQNTELDRIRKELQQERSTKEAALREGSEHKGQVQALKEQYSELLKTLGKTGEKRK